MRKVYLLSNIIFIATVVFLLNAYSQRVQNATEAAGKQKTRKKKITKKKKLNIPKHRPVVVHDYTSIIAESKLFDKDRGADLAVPAKAPKRNQRCNLKLMGICQVGKLKGAIIVSSRRTNNSSSKSFFKIGEDVGEGYKLYDITAKTAILKSGSRKLELELEKVKATASNARSTRRPPITRSRRTSRPSHRRR